MKKILCACLAMMLLVGCHKAKESVQEQTNNDAATMNSFDDSYYKIINVSSAGSELRENFYLGYGTSGDFQTIGRGLQILSSDYFSTSNHYMSEGNYLKLALKNEMESRKSENSIQPPSGSTIGGVKDPVMVQNVQEQDYYVKDGNKYTLKGMAFAIIIDPRDSGNARLETPMSQSDIESFGRECISKFYNVIQKHEDFKKVKDVPVLITIYRATDATSSTIDGNYILKSYCQKEVGEISKINHENVLFTSERAEEIDKTTYADFNAIKTSLKNTATEAAGFVGEARYVDGEIQSMLITANLNVKTYTELMALTSLIADGIDNKFTYDFPVKVLVKSQDQLQAIVVKEKGGSAKSWDLY
ncbi:MAG: CamS family sex pheromone protein [Longibaculum sp.]